MAERTHGVIIAGAGLAALSCAARLTELGVTDIGLYARGLGGTPVIAAINFVLPGNPYGDTPAQYAKDMLDSGYGIGNRALVEAMTQRTVDGYDLLRRWGVEFARNPDGSPKLRHLSGHTYPRSLCSTRELIGQHMAKALRTRLEARGVAFYPGCRVAGLLAREGRVSGIAYLDAQGKLNRAYAPAVVAAWGGVGNLLGQSTYPGDVSGDTLAIAHDAGASLVDIEFLEYEPMVVLSPPGAVGEPCPTAMLGEGAYLRNSLGQRFLLNVRPQGEGGATKTLINREIWRQVEAGNGSPHGGVYVDLRHIHRTVLEGYPWFYNRLMDNGVDPKAQLVEVGPMAHSFSGGIWVDGDYQSTVEGLYAVGEACGGVHGACRCAGNAASQAVLSGMICAEAIGQKANLNRPLDEAQLDYRVNEALRGEYLGRIQSLAAGALGVYRDGPTLQSALDALGEMLESGQLDGDTLCRQTAQSVYLMAQAALARRETRGNQRRKDYPQPSEEFQKQIIV